jgi:DNA polymerase III epsilon subunit-like protein
MANSMQHWNGNQLCAMDIETTGLDPFWHEAVQICILPLDSNIQIRKDLSPFYINLKPDYPERATKEALRKNKLDLVNLIDTGFDRIAAIDMLDDWIKKLNLPVTKYGNPKQIIPLGQNYTFDQIFIIKWLGQELYNQYFHYYYRDTMISANWLNDCAAFHAETVPFSKTGLQWLCNKLNIKSERTHDALSDCISCAAVYKQLISKGVIF